MEELSENASPATDAATGKSGSRPAAQTHAVIAGFWRRLLAFVIDCTFLGAIGQAVGFLLRQQFVEMGAWGRLVGFVVALAYFGTLNSRVGGGRTVGKRLLKIRVVNRRGRSLPLSLSFVRFLPLGLSWFLNGAPYSQDVLRSGWSFLLSIAVFGLGFSLVYLYVFNRTTRQSLHDLLVGSYVVAAPVDGPVVAQPPWRLHIAVSTLLVAASAVVPYLTRPIASSDPYAGLLAIQRVVSEEPWVIHAGVTAGTTWFQPDDTPASESTYLDVAIYMRDDRIDDHDRARRIARLALSAYPPSAAMDVIGVTLLYGFDIGIASSWKFKNHAHAPAEWKE